MTGPRLPFALLCWSICWGCAGDEAQSGLDPESLVTACVRTAACGINARARVSDCVEAYDQRAAPLGLVPVLDPIYRCANRATSCAAIDRCFGGGGACDKSFAGSCDGGQALFCDLIDKRVYRYDCGAVGLDCTLDPGNGFAADCTGPARSGTLRRSPSCPADRCQQTAEPCDPDELDRCKGAALQSCLEGRWFRFDCAALGLGPCEPGAQGVARCGDGS